MLTDDNNLGFSFEMSKLIKDDYSLIEFISKHSFSCLWIWKHETPENLIVDKHFFNSHGFAELLQLNESNIQNFFSDNRFTEFSKKLHQFISNRCNSVTSFSIKKENNANSFYKVILYPITSSENHLVSIVGGSIAVESLDADDKGSLLNEIDLLKQQLLSDKFLFNQIMENLPINVYTKDLFLKKTFANLCEINFCGAKSLEEVLDKTDLDFYGEKVAKDSMEEDSQVIHKKNFQIHKEVKFTKKDGSDAWIFSSKVPLLNEDNEVTGILGTSIDITEQKQQQFEIDKKQLLLDTLTKQVPGILFQFKMDTSGQFSWPFVSERAKEIYEISPDEYYRNPNILVENTDPQYIQPLFEAIQISAQNLSSFAFESKTYSKTGNVKWILTESIPQKQEDGSIVWSGYSQDITLRKMAEIELEMTKNNLESIFNSISEVVFSIRPYTGELLFLTPSVEQIFGFTIEQVEKDNEILKSAIVHEDRKVLEENDKSLEKTGKFSSECRIKNAMSGDIKWISQNGKFIYNNDGKPIRIDCITKDITEKKLRELALIKSEAKFRSYVENAPNVIFTHDVKGNINYIVQNSFASKLTYINRVPEKRNILSLIHPDDIDIVLPSFRHLIKNKESINTQPFRIKTEAGNYEWRVVNSAPLLNDDGEIAEILTISTDVNSLIEKEKALIIEKAKANKLSDYYQSLLDSQSVYVVKTDTKGYYTYVNEGFKKSFGCDDSIIGTFSFDLIIQEDWEICREAAQKCMQQPEVYHKVNLRKPTKEGEIKMGTWEFMGKLNVNGELEEILCIGYDITELNKLLEETRELLRITADQNNRLQNFTYIISHNIRSHSANLQGVVKLMEETNNEEDKAILFEMLKLSTERLEETIKNLNEIIAIKKEINTPKEYKNIYSEIHKTLDILIDDVNESKAKIMVDIPLDVQIKVIPAYLDSILLNLFSNALKYRSKERNCEISINVEKIKGYIIVYFKDNGIGMNMKFVKDKIFGMYKTFHKNSDAKGLGLFLTKNQVEAMGGKIEVDSHENVGSIFKLFFYDDV